MQLLSEANTSKLLGDITHLRAVVFETPRPQRTAPQSGAGAQPGNAQPGSPSSGNASSVLGYYE